MAEDVVIVGAGPVGLALGCELLARGVPCRVIDKAPAPSAWSKALAVHARTLEALERLGLADEAVAAGRRLRAFNAYAGGERIIRLGFEDIDSAYPFVLILPQGETERILAAALARRGGAVERGVELVALVAGEGGRGEVLLSSPAVDRRPRARTRDAAGRESEIRPAWVVGADGAHSGVRHALAIPFEGAAYEEVFALADLRVDTSLAPDESHVFFAPEGVLLVLPLPAPGLFRIVADVTRTPGVEAALGLFQQLLAARGPAHARASEPVWTSIFRFHRRIAARYRAGRAFLAGDAAHIHSPAGGQGMNTGIQDAENLAWKLALVARGEGHEALLDSYEAERRPVAAATLVETDRLTWAMTLRNPLTRLVRDHIAAFALGFEPVRRRIVRTVAEVDIAYAPSAFVAEDRAARRGAGGPLPGTRAPAVGAGEPRGTGHALLAFSGPTGLAEAARAAALVRERWGGLVTPSVVVPRGERPALPPWEGPVILDADGAAHRRYGAEAGARLYLIRPDGVVGFRGDATSTAALTAHLEGTFLLPLAPGKGAR